MCHHVLPPAFYVHGLLMIGSMVEMPGDTVPRGFSICMFQFMCPCICRLVRAGSTYGHQWVISRHQMVTSCMLASGSVHWQQV